jgi:hypothetical protein
LPALAAAALEATELSSGEAGPEPAWSPPGDGADPAGCSDGPAARPAWKGYGALSALVDGLTDDAFEIDARLRRALSMEQRLDAHMGPLLFRVWNRWLHRALGYRTRESYARERLDMDPTRARALVRLERAAMASEPFARAYRSGALSWVKAGLLVPLIGVDPLGHFMEEWISWAQQVTDVFSCWGIGKKVPAEHRAFERDGWLCRVPGCSSMQNLQDHHIVFRSRGGSDDLTNRVAVCAFHHLRGIHAQRIRCVGRAPDGLTWQIGVRPDAAPLATYTSRDRIQTPQRARDTSTGSSLVSGCQNGPWPRGMSPAQRSSTGSPLR